jgi:hypothetical protein
MLLSALLLILDSVVMGPTLDIELELQPRQLELYDLYEHGRASIIGYGGSRGGAKSHGGRNVMLLRRYQYPKTNAFIIRRTLDDLRDNHIYPMLREHPYLWPYFGKQEKLLSLPNGSSIRFISSDNYDDVFKLIGKEAADVFVDQAEQFSQDQLEFLTTINRSTANTAITPKMLLTFNPGDIGHTYLKRVFVQREYEGNEQAEEFAFIRAFGWDNVEWSRKALIEDGLTAADYYAWTDDKRFEYFTTRSDYGRKLNTLPDSQRKAQLYGDFDVFEGQFFSMWRDAIHYIDPITVIPQWPLIGGLDYGQRTVLEVATRDYEGRIIFIAEHYTTHETPTERFNGMADMLIERKLFNLPIVYDTNMDINLKEYTGYDKSPAQIAREVFEQRMKDQAPSLRVVSKATTDKRGYRVVCNEAVKDYLLIRDDGKPRLYVTRNCPKLAKTLPELIEDPDSIDGLDFRADVGEDDPFDAAKTALMELRTPAHPSGLKKPKTWAEEMAARAKASQGWKPGMG